MPNRRMTSFIPPRVTALEIIVICLIALCILLLVTNNVDTFIRVLYSPISFLVLIVVLGEYIILKSADRSRIYKIELEQLRRRQLENLKLFHRLEQQLDTLLAAVENLQNNSVLTEADKKAAQNLKEQLKNIRERVHMLI